MPAGKGYPKPKMANRRNGTPKKSMTDKRGARKAKR